MSNTSIGISFLHTEASDADLPPSKRLSAEQKKDLAAAVLSGSCSVSELADKHHVSRKYLYSLANRAKHALDQEFSPDSEEDEALFYLPVTKRWLTQLVIGLVLICSASYRQVIELFEALLDQSISIGTVHNYMQEATQKAIQINQQEDLEAVQTAALDEIFQGSTPVLAVADTESTYCALLKTEECRDGDTWGVNLLDLEERGFAPNCSIADYGRGLRAGHRVAREGETCRGDVFHPIRDLNDLAEYLKKRALRAMSKRETLEKKARKARRNNQGRTYSRKLGEARKTEREAIRLADNVYTLARWMEEEILSISGPSYSDRIGLYDFVVDHLKELEEECKHRIRPVRVKLENHRESMLAFARSMEEEFQEIADQFEVPLYLVIEICRLEGLDPQKRARWRKRETLYKKLGWKFHSIYKEVKAVMDKTVRASSIIENLNSRLRRYFFLRRHLGNDYLELLRFYLNHRTFMRSRRPEREGKSPAQLLGGEDHPHWLELLGFETFSQS